MRFHRFSRIALITAAAGLTLSPSAHAIVVTVASTTDNTTFVLGGDANSRQGLSSLGITNAGGSGSDIVGTMLQAGTRYASVAVADNGNGGNATDSARVQTDYTVQFSVTALAGSQYTVEISTALLGSLTLVDDYSIGNGTSGFSNISNVAGSLGGIGNANLSLSSATASPNGTSGTSDTPFSFSNVLNLGPVLGTGSSQVFEVRFVFETFAQSNATSSTFDNADEAAVRLGLTGTINGGGGTFEGPNGGQITADDYPGANNRILSADGHFVNVKVTLTAVPEVSSMVLAGMGVAALGAFVVHRRQCG